MEQWVWFIAYVGGFGLLQVVLYRLFKQRTTTTTTTEGQVSRSAGGRFTATQASEAISCQHCGTVNEVHPAVRYCRDCTESIR